MRTETVCQQEIKINSSVDNMNQQLRPAIFPSLPPFINFLRMNEKYEGETLKLEIPWNIWIPCSNPLLLHTFLRAGFVRRQVSLQVSGVNTRVL